MGCLFPIPSCIYFLWRLPMVKLLSHLHRCTLEYWWALDSHPQLAGHSSGSSPPKHALYPQHLADSPFHPYCISPLPLSYTLQWVHCRLKVTLNLSEPFDTCIWAMASCAFFGMMHFGEVSVTSWSTFSGAKHLKCSDVFLGSDLNRKHYAHLDLPSAKTAKPGEIQSVYLTAQGDLCPLEALANLTWVVPAGPNNPLFSWRDKLSDVRPMVKTKALLHINMILDAWGWGTAFGHSFRIGGASFYLAQGVNPEIVRLAGHWKSLAYEAYIRAFEQITSRHMSNLATQST